MKLIPKYQFGTPEGGVQDNTRVVNPHIPIMQSVFKSPIQLMREAEYKKQIDEEARNRSLAERQTFIGPAEYVPMQLQNYYADKEDTRRFMERKRANEQLTDKMMFGVLDAATFGIPAAKAAVLTGRMASQGIKRLGRAWAYRGVNASNTPVGLLPDARPLVAGGVNEYVSLESPTIGKGFIEGAELTPNQVMTPVRDLELTTRRVKLRRNPEQIPVMSPAEKQAAIDFLQDNPEMRGLINLNVQKGARMDWRYPEETMQKIRAQQRGEELWDKLLNGEYFNANRPSTARAVDNPVENLAQKQASLDFAEANPGISIQRMSAGRPKSIDPVTNESIYYPKEVLDKIKPKKIEVTSAKSEPIKPTQPTQPKQMVKLSSGKRQYRKKQLEKDENRRLHNNPNSITKEQEFLSSGDRRKLNEGRKGTGGISERNAMIISKRASINSGPLQREAQSIRLKLGKYEEKKAAGLNVSESYRDQLMKQLKDLAQRQLAYEKYGISALK